MNFKLFCVCGIGHKASCNKYYWDMLVQFLKIFKADDFSDTDRFWFVLCSEKEIMDHTFVCMFHFFFGKAEGGRESSVGTEFALHTGYLQLNGTTQMRKY